MGINRVANVGIKRIDLSHGDWLEVKLELSVKDGRKIVQATEKGGDFVAVARILAWVHDWSLRDASDKPIRLNEAGIDSLGMRTLVEINKALDAHIDEVDAEQEKNGHSDPTSTDPISPSAS